MDNITLNTQSLSLNTGHMSTQCYDADFSKDASTQTDAEPHSFINKLGQTNYVIYPRTMNVSRPSWQGRNTKIQGKDKTRFSPY